MALQQNLKQQLAGRLNRLTAAAEARIPASLRSRWSGLPPRDQRALKCLAGVLLLALLYLLIWQPVMQQVDSKRQWQQQQSERIEQAQLAAYDRLNRFGTADLVPVSLWLEDTLPAHQLSLVQHRDAEAGTAGQLTFRYSDARQAWQFLVAMSRFNQLSEIRVDQNRRVIALRYQLAPDYVELL